MRILQLTKKFPLPARDGETIAITNLALALKSQGAVVDLLSLNTSRHKICVEKQNIDLHNWYQNIQFVPIDNRINSFGAFKNLFTNQSYHISRFLSTAFEEKLKFILKNTKYDVVQLETIYLAPYISIIRKYSNALIAVRAHNLEHEIWERVIENTKNPIKKGYLYYLTQKLKRFEISTFNKFDLLIPITSRDELLFCNLGYKGPSVVAPIGLDTKAYIPNWKSFQNTPSLSFIGGLDWVPNQEGLFWFLNDIWPRLVKEHPKLTFHIAGRNPPKNILSLNIKGVTVHGEVDSSKDFINAHSMMVVPLLSGSGMRVKILEGMALGRVVITTSVGVEGINAHDKKEIILADNPDEFVNKISQNLSNPKLLIQIGKNAFKKTNDQYAIDFVASDLSHHYNLGIHSEN